ncbi:MAG: hypothetical protein P8O08_03820, partial [Paracoccaceae bacterium]|nr:hypothetical protein [Paracoccaceae bacterium]
QEQQLNAAVSDHSYIVPLNLHQRQLVSQFFLYRKNTLQLCGLGSHHCYFVPLSQRQRLSTP